MLHKDVISRARAASKSKGGHMPANSLHIFFLGIDFYLTCFLILYVLTVLVGVTWSKKTLDHMYKKQDFKDSRQDNYPPKLPCIAQHLLLCK